MKSVLLLNERNITVKTFSGGEVQASLDEAIVYSSVYNVIEARIKCSDGLIALCQLKDMLRHLDPKKELHLKLPYVPYARYDRRMKEVDSQSLKVFCNILNSLDFDKVIIADPHSYVAENLINNCHVETQLLVLGDSVVPGRLNMGNYTSIVAPDAGSTKKALQIANYFDLPVVQCEKVRDKQDNIVNFSVYYDNTCDFQEDVLIVDDICDGGRTFLGLAEELKRMSKGKGRVDLYVTHGIFSHGTNDLLKYIDNIYCKYSWIEDDRIIYDTLF